MWPPFFWLPNLFLGLKKVRERLLGHSCGTLPEALAPIGAGEVVNAATAVRNFRPKAA